MRLKFKEDPKEWRKSAWLTLGGLAFISSLLRWKHHVSQPAWLTFLFFLAVLALLAFAKPGFFRGYYRLSLRIGFYLSKWIGQAVLLFFFFLVITPLAICFRLAGKDVLELKLVAKKSTYWKKSKPSAPLDQQF